MQAFVVKEHGGPEVLQWTHWPDPVAGHGDVVVKVAAVGINHLDIWVRKGVDGHRFPLPMVPGSDIVGTVVEQGSGVPKVAADRRFLVSPGTSCGQCPACLSGEDALCPDYGILGESRDGGYAQFVRVPHRNLIPLPESLSWAEAASMPLTFLTAWHMLVTRARLQPGQTVLIHAAASGVSSAALQIAALLGAQVIATASTEGKLAHARRLGAAHLINYRDADWPRQVREWTGGEGVDLVVDHVGGAIFKRSVGCLKKGGQLVFCGATAGHRVELDLRPIFFKGLSILGSTMGSLHELRRIMALVAQGKLQPNQLTEMPLNAAPEAHSRLEAREIIGKVVLVA